MKKQHCEFIFYFWKLLLLVVVDELEKLQSIKLDLKKWKLEWSKLKWMAFFNNFANPYYYNQVCVLNLEQVFRN
jgi:hypothetical protein